MRGLGALLVARWNAHHVGSDVARVGRPCGRREATRLVPCALAPFGAFPSSFHFSLDTPDQLDAVAQLDESVLEGLRAFEGEPRLKRDSAK
jgi:hypothetical protein